MKLKSRVGLPLGICKETAKTSISKAILLWLHSTQVRSLTQFYSVDFSRSKIGAKKCSLFQKHNQGLRQLLLIVSWYHRAQCAGQIWCCPCISVVPEAMHGASQGSEMETRELLGGTGENSVSPMRGHYFALHTNQWFFYKKETEKNWVSCQTWC